LSDTSPPRQTPPKTIRADLAHHAARRARPGQVIALAAGLGVVLTLLFLGVWVWKLAFSDLPSIPDKATLWSLNRPAGATFLDRNGAVIGQRGPLHGKPLTLAELPRYVPEAFLAAEDQHFYSHPGVDLGGMARAARNDLIGNRRLLQGGSTITQQIARTLFLTPEQTVRRKLQEAGLALRIEHLMSKDEILELYLNRIYFGGGAYGVEAASQIYFAKSATGLSLSEAALLASLPKAPTHLSPGNDFDAALARSHLVLRSMQRLGWITAAEEKTAEVSPPKLAMETRTEGDFGYVLDLAALEARQANVNNVPDLVVRLTVDPRLQAEAAAAVRDAVAKGTAQGATQGALVALEPDGGVLALVGGVDHRLSPFDRAIQALRQPGSAFKPFVYAAALEAGLKPDDVRADAPFQVGDWRPENDDRRYAGNVTLSDALARSINTVAARVSQEVGTDRVAALARRFGLVNIPPHPAPPLALGAYEVTLLDLVSAYEVFQQDGQKSSPYLIASITNARGDPIYSHTPTAPQPIYDPTRARTMTQMMQGVIEHGTARRADIGRPAAGKTGTSTNARDAWFVGYTPDVTAGVWIGDDKGRPMQKVEGGTLPAETWKRFMLAAEAGLPVRPFVPPNAAKPEEAVSANDAAEQARRDFYGALADQFDQAASGSPPIDAPRPEIDSETTNQTAAPP
jgi:penicillin-binding protein 1A